MQASSIVLRVLLWTLVLALGSFAVSQPAEGVSPTLMPAATANSVHLSARGNLAFFAPSAAAPAPRITVDVSIMPPGPGPLDTCSVENSGTTCSAETADALCSAFHANDNLCTALRGANVQCSASASGAICSVLPPSMSGGDSMCSADSLDDNVRCSTFTVDGQQKCSIKAAGGSTCSAFRDFPTVECSVFNVGATIKSFCSTKLGTAAVAKLCSAFATNAACSIQLGGKGRCSAFGAALPASCTAHAAGSFCSVLGGATGNPCIQ